MTVVLPEIVSRQIFMYGLYEPELSSMMISTLRPGMTFVDIGAHYGYFSVLAALAVGTSGNIYAFEPTPRTHQILSANLRAIPNHRTEQLAVSARNGTATLHDWGTEYSAYASLKDMPRMSSHESAGIVARHTEVGTVALDSYFSADQRSPDWIKIDAESTEIDILNGMRRILQDGNPVVSVEVGDVGVAGAGESSAIVDFMTGLNYASFETVGPAWRPHSRRETYDYGNLIFAKEPLPASLSGNESDILRSDI
jgi:FkbM family methyltransferase